MEKVIQNNLVFRRSLVTGPTHNFLSITFAHTKPTEIKFKANSQLERSENREILRELLAATKFPTANDLFPACVEYCEDDTPSKGCYGRVLQLIVKATQKAYPEKKQDLDP